MILMRYENDNRPADWCVRCLKWYNDKVTGTQLWEHLTYGEAIQQVRTLAITCPIQYMTNVNVWTCHADGQWTSITPISITDVQQDDEFALALLQI